jgi:tetratricopeptide (TPR) repeat protein
LFERDGHVRGSRFCAGCHDPVPFFSGEFEDPRFDDPDYDLANDKDAQAGITCTVCHSITAINSVKGNASYTIEQAQHYPFAFSENAALRWINRQMILSKPAFHKATFLKPLHKTPEFCGSCHKVHLPPELNDYKWLRGQNHYDAFLLSGVSGHGVTSFYYPPKAETSCNNCHMPLKDSSDFGAKDFGGKGAIQVHSHLFPSANTALPHLLNLPASVNEAHAEFQKGVMRVDIFGLREGGTIDGALSAPLRPRLPALEAGKRYLIETVIRTLKMGHVFTQGTSDSNEVWLDVTVKNGERVIGRSGGMRESDREVDPWSHFVNAFVIDRDGVRIDRRNAESIFLPLYNHQIAPGAADVVHFRLDVPAEARGEIQIDVALRYRKFDTTYMRLFQGAEFVVNDLPILTLATDSITLAVGSSPSADGADSSIPAWQRWNDYGIGGLLKGGESGPHKGELRQAEEAFLQVEQLKRPDGPLNLARVYIREGRLDEAAVALRRAAAFEPSAPPWSIAWHTGLLNKQNGDFDAALENFRALATMDSAETRERGFDFSKDYRLLNELGRTCFERAKQERGESRRAARETLLREARDWHERALLLDPENADAHYGLTLLYEELGDANKAQQHRAEHERYKPDDNASDQAIAAARKRYPAADRAAEPVVIYDLGRPGAYGLAAGASAVEVK